MTDVSSERKVEAEEAREGARREVSETARERDVERRSEACEKEARENPDAHRDGEPFESSLRTLLPRRAVRS